MTGRLKLMAMDDEDLPILSTYCQDAVLRVSDITFLPKERRFVLAMNRFVWEQVEPGKRTNYRRCRSILHFERVEQVRSRSLNRKDPDLVLELLAITFAAKQAPAGTIELAFSGGATLQLDVECVEAQLTDMAAMWETVSRPIHRDVS